MSQNPLVYLAIALSLVIGGGIAYYSMNPSQNAQYVPVSAKPVDVEDIAPHADGIPAPIRRTANETIVVNLRATQVVSELADGTTYEYWTYNNQVPGPFIRVMEGDTVEVRLTHEHAHHAQGEHNAPDYSFALEAFTSAALANGSDGHMMSGEEMEHAVAGHGEHSVDLHAVLGPGGGAGLTRVGPNETKAFQFKVMRPGLYIYHCASAHVPSHIANGMYGLILVEPKGGLPLVDKEFYVVQGELYTKGALGQKGHQELDKEKLLAERPEYFVFNGRTGALTGTGALRTNVGEKVRIFFGVSGQLASNFHIIGEIFDNLYPEGDIVSPPHKNVQTTLVPAGGAAMVEFTAEVPGTYLLVDHALTRAIDRGALGEFIVEGEARPDIYKKVE